MEIATSQSEANPIGDYRQVLKRSFLRRREKNGSYSLRSFARDLEVSASMLSEVMNYKKSLSHKTAIKILPALNLSQPEAEMFVLAIDLEQQNPLQTKADIRGQIEERAAVGRMLTLDEDRFSLISDYRHYVALALFGIRNFRYNPAWIAELIGGFQFQVKEIFKRLQRVGMVRFDSQGQPELLHDFANSSDNIPSEALRIYHRATLNRALDSIAEVPVTERDFCSYLYAIDQDDFSAMQAEIREFQRRLYQKYARKSTADRVYGLQTQLIPYTQRSRK